MKTGLAPNKVCQKNRTCNTWQHLHWAFLATPLEIGARSTSKSPVREGKKINDDFRTLLWQKYLKGDVTGKRMLESHRRLPSRKSGSHRRKVKQAVTETVKTVIGQTEAREKYVGSEVKISEKNKHARGRLRQGQSRLMSPPMEIKQKEVRELTLSQILKFHRMSQYWQHL